MIVEDTVKKIMVRKVITCNPEASLQNVAKTMHKNNIGCLVVIKGKIPIGIVTERDMVSKAMVENLDGSKTRVGRIMSSPLKTIKPEDKIYYANSILQRAGIKKLPVVKNGKLIGIVTQTDIIKYFTKIRNLLALDKFGKSIKSA